MNPQTEPEYSETAQRNADRLYMCAMHLSRAVHELDTLEGLEYEDYEGTRDDLLDIIKDLS